MSDDVASPCIKVCVIDPRARLCTGCLRTLDEIAAWGSLSSEARRAVLADLPARADLLSPDARAAMPGRR